MSDTPLAATVTTLHLKHPSVCMGPTKGCVRRYDPSHVCVCVGASARGRCRLCRRTSRLPEAGLQRGVEGHVRGVLKNTTAPHTDGGPPAPNPPRGAGAGGCYPKPWQGGEAPGP